MEQAYATEYNIAQRRANFVGYFSVLKDTLNAIDSDKYCQFILQTDADITREFPAIL